MRDPALEAGRLREFLVEMDRVVIAGNDSEGLDIGGRDDALVRGAHAHLQLLDRVTARRNIRHLPPRSGLLRRTLTRESAITKPPPFAIAAPSLLWRPAGKGAFSWTSTAQRPCARCGITRFP